MLEKLWKLVLFLLEKHLVTNDLPDATWGHKNVNFAAFEQQLLLSLQLLNLHLAAVTR